MTKRKIRFVAMCIVGGLFGLSLSGVFFVPIPEGNQTLAAALAGSLGGSFGTIVAFYFGDSETKEGE